MVDEPLPIVNVIDSNVVGCNGGFIDPILGLSETIATTPPWF